MKWKTILENVFTRVQGEREKEKKNANVFYL